MMTTETKTQCLTEHIKLSPRTPFYEPRLLNVVLRKTTNESLSNALQNLMSHRSISKHGLNDTENQWKVQAEQEKRRADELQEQVKQLQCQLQVLTQILVEESVDDEIICLK